MVGVRITVGRFSLAIGAEEGTRAAPAPKPERRSRAKLAEARRNASRTARAAQTLETAGAELESTIAAVERADELVSMLTKGVTLDPKVLEQQIGRLLDLVDRADREGRLDDQLRLARSLVALLALVPRWLALLQVLERLAGAAASVGDAVAEGWARHELGTLALSADDAQAATSELERALRLRRDAGDATGAEVTGRNLELVPLAAEGAEQERIRIRRRRLLLAAGVLAAAVVLGIGAAAVLADDPDGDGPTTAAETTVPTTDETTGGTTEAGDTEPPSVLVSVPSEQVRGSIEVTADASDPSGVTRVAFSASGPATVDLGEDTDEPFIATWDTSNDPDGEYAVVATATDDVGNDGESEPATVLVDNTPPTVTLATPESTETGSLLSAEAEDGGSGVASVRFELAGDSEAPDWRELATVESPTDGASYETTFDTSGGEGTYLVRAVAVDAVGNEEISNVQRIVVIN